MLNAEQIDKLKGVLVLTGWREVMRPLIEQRARVVKEMAFLLPGERPKPYAELDDQTATAFLRGENKGLEWVMHVFENEIAVHDANRMREELSHRDNGANPTGT